MNIEGKITLESRGCSPELLKKLYFDDRLTIRGLMRKFNIRDQKVMDRWFMECGITKRDSNRTYEFNKYYFDAIDTERKAYWLGFIWCDSYVLRRERKGNNVAYEFKLSLCEQDSNHLNSLNEDLESNYPIKQYKFHAFEKDYIEYRLYIANKYFAKNLFENFGLIPHRHEVDKLISKVPEEFHRHFIRGIMDADGSIVDCYVNDKYIKSGPSRKVNLSFYTYEKLLDFIQDYFIEHRLIENRTKYIKRHEGADMFCTGLAYSGAIQIPRILSHLYESAEIYLESKHKKYKRMISRGDKTDLAITQT